VTRSRHIRHPRTGLTTEQRRTRILEMRRAGLVLGEIPDALNLSGSYVLSLLPPPDEDPVILAYWTRCAKADRKELQ